MNIFEVASEVKEKVFYKAVNDRLRGIVRYDPKTGFFYWESQQSSCGRVGMRADIEKSLKSGKKYRVLVFDGSEWSAHNLAWAYMNGGFIASGVRHLDGDRTNNRYENLYIPVEEKKKKVIKKKKGVNTVFGVAQSEARRRRWERENGPISKEAWQDREEGV